TRQWQEREKQGQRRKRRVALRLRPVRCSKYVAQSTISKRYSSITGLVSTSFEMRSSCRCASSRVPPSRVNMKNLPWRTSVTAAYPSPERACWMVCPCGSRTVRFGITQTCAFMCEIIANGGEKTGDCVASGFFHFAQQTASHVVDKTAGHDLLRNPRVRPQLLQLVADILFDIPEGIEKGRRDGCGSGGVLDARSQILFGGAHQSAIRVVDNHEFFGAQQVVRNEQRTQAVVSNDASRVADDVRVTRSQAQSDDGKTGVHAGQNREFPFRTRSQRAEFVRACVNFVCFENLINGAHGFRKFSAACEKTHGASAVGWFSFLCYAGPRERRGMRCGCLAGLLVRLAAYFSACTTPTLSTPLQAM